MSKKWYIVSSSPGYENKVRESLAARIREAGLDESFGRIEVPSEEMVEMRAGKKTVTTKRMFPGYVFIEMEFSDPTWHLVRKTPKVTGFVGGSAKPKPMTDAEINTILSRQERSHEKPKPKIEFSQGEIVRIKNGPFTDFNSTIASVDFEKGKAKVLVSVFGRDTPIEIQFDDIEKIA